MHLKIRVATLMPTNEGRRRKKKKESKHSYSDTNTRVATASVGMKSTPYFIGTFLSDRYPTVHFLDCFSLFTQLPWGRQAWLPKSLSPWMPKLQNLCKRLTFQWLHLCPVFFFFFSAMCHEKRKATHCNGWQMHAKTKEACFHGTTGGEQVSPMKNLAFYFLSACICNFICSSHATPRQQPRYTTIQNQTFASK